MRPNDIENWGLHIIERVESKQLVEDSRVELKAEWPTDHSKAARQIAGHANSARGEPILWLIGVDEIRGVTGANYEEISNWKQSVEAEFDGLAPTLSHLNIPYQNKTVVALLWQTEGMPFLVKNPLYGKPAGGPISLEVPWREGGSTRTANRTDILKLLYPVTKAPSFEVIRGEFNISKGQQDGYGQILCEGGLSLDVYIVPGSTSRLVIPCHKCEAKFTFVESALILSLRIMFDTSFSAYPSKHSAPHTSPINCTAAEIIVDGPGMARISTFNPSISPEQYHLVKGNLELQVKMLPVGFDVPILIVATFNQVETPKGAIGRWTVKTTRSNRQEDKLNLTKEEINYLLKIADQEGKIYHKLLSAFSGRDTEIYREMLNKFVQISLMREELDYWALTAKGYAFCEELRQQNDPNNDERDTSNTND